MLQMYNLFSFSLIQIKGDEKGPLSINVFFEVGLARLDRFNRILDTSRRGRVASYSIQLNRFNPTSKNPFILRGPIFFLFFSNTILFLRHLYIFGL
jgi:hypothetical protein